MIRLASCAWQAIIRPEPGRPHYLNTGVMCEERRAFG